MRIVRYADVRPGLWANGAGETRELWSDAVGEGTGFARRISVASLIRPAPFSHLPGMFRTFMPIDDMVVRLVIDGEAVRLGRWDAISFSGDVAVSLVELDRPGRVLNVMSDAAAWEHAVSIDSHAEACDAALLLEGDVGDLLIEPDLSDTQSLKVAAIRFSITGR